MMAATSTAVPIDEQQSVIRFSTLEYVMGSEIRVGMCIAHRMLSQNQL